MSSIGFAKRSLQGGTNRRAVKAAFDLFLCSKVDDWKDSQLETTYIARDIDRNPGGNRGAFNSNCRSCHSVLDSLRPAFAYYDYNAMGDPLRVASVDPFTSKTIVARKYNQNGTIYPEGFITTSDSWENLLVLPGAQERYGWRGPTSGRGLMAFGSMIANSKQFQTCISKRLVSAICDFDEVESTQILESPEFKSLVDEFRKDGYVIKTLIKKIALSGLCQK